MVDFNREGDNKKGNILPDQRGVIITDPRTQEGHEHAERKRRTCVFHTHPTGRSFCFLLKIKLYNAVGE